MLSRSMLALAALACAGLSPVSPLQSPRALQSDAIRAAASRIEGQIVVPALGEPVEVLRDEWGIPHIYARSQRDLFVAQGFVAAQDRLFQMEMWRRTGEGKLAEVLGPSAVARDRFARLVRYRGDMRAEWTSYAPDARPIIEAFVAGVNANVALRRGSPPLEFRLLGFEPEPWTPEACITRMAGFVMTRNASNEVLRAQLVRAVGPAQAAAILPPDPPVALEVPRGLDLEGIDPSVLGGSADAARAIAFDADAGSNNWTVSGRLTATGKPILANDPHRPILLPSLRYMTHLVAPGWNVIGAGEPTLPGVAVGHNESVAFGFTIVGIDQQDLYVEELNPANALEYRHGGRWRRMEVVREQIRVKGRDRPEEVDLHFTVHGPVLHEDPARRRAYALRWVGSEPGTAGYLGSLALDRARNWREFLDALERWKVPSENLAYADREGNIGWQAAGLTPVRKGWNGLLPVPGGGDYEWRGFLPPSSLPRSFNPPQGFIATANHNILPPGYGRALGYDWASPWRFRRIDEVLRSRSSFTIEDFARLQHDETSLPARELVRLLRTVRRPEGDAAEPVDILFGWNGVLQRDSRPAALYELWVQKLAPRVWKEQVSPEVARIVGGRASLDRALAWLASPAGALSRAEARDRILLETLAEAWKDFRERGAPVWGGLHHAAFAHPLGTRHPELNRGPVPRGGDGNTVNATSFGSGFRQSSGASYRQILDLADWDRSIATNVPGQSGEPGSAHYDDLLKPWADGAYHPLLFSRAAVERATRHRLHLVPRSFATDGKEGAR